MSLIELRTFNAIAAEHSFVKAAQALYRSQQTLSMQLCQLERRYDVELVIRSRGRMLGLTPLGRELKQITSRLFTLEQDAMHLLANAKTLAVGRLQLGAIAPNSGIRTMHAFANKYPNIEIALTFGNSGHVLEQIVNGAIDVGILGGHEADPDCDAQILARPEIVLVVAHDHPAAATGIIGREAFARETLLLRETGSETRDLLLAGLERHAYAPARRVEIGSREGVVIAAAEGLGVAAVSDLEFNPTPALAVVRFADFRIHGVLYTVSLKSRSNSRLIAEFRKVATSVASPGAASLAT